VNPICLKLDHGHPEHGLAGGINDRFGRYAIRAVAVAPGDPI
jgi:hypothetical protein